MSNAYLTGWVTDVRRHVRFVPTNAIVTSCRNPLVLVFNQHGYFFVPNLEAGKTYEFSARNGAALKKIRFTPKRGHNDLEIVVLTKPARVSESPRKMPSSRKPPLRRKPLSRRQAGA
jgi:hypothetical protein